MSELKKILSQLVSFPSITPEDKGCQAFMISYFQQLGFTCKQYNTGSVNNFFACYGDEGPLLVFAGHTDVVPPGDNGKWHTDPFQLEDKAGMLYGRGVADMKGSLACMMLMANQFVKTYPSFPGRLGFLITSGEEGDDFEDGTPHVMEKLENQGIAVDYCIVGEPSSSRHVGDVIKVGRRGSLTAKITLHGIQGHVAYPQLAKNPIHMISPVLADLTKIQWDNGNNYFPPTSMQMTSIHSSGQASNIIPGDIFLQLNFRFSTEQTVQSLINIVETCFTNYELNPDIEWQLNGEPFLTEKGVLLDCCVQAIKEKTGVSPELSTSGGTSDGRFIAPYGVEVIEIGPVNATIHQVNECVSLRDLEVLQDIYLSISKKILKVDA